MPVEIRELIIRATVSTNTSTSSSSAISSSGPLSMTTNEALIQACVSQVMQLLEKQKER
jgi:Family of unknown function (DUF5908)